MTYRRLMYIGGAAAIFGGAPRVLASFIPFREGVLGLEIFYGLIDLCLLFGLFAVYLSESKKLGWLGLVSFIVAASGLSSIVGPDVRLGSVDMYQLGAAATMIGLSGLSVAMLWAHVMQPAALYWLAALGFGTASTLTGSPFVFALAGVVFGVGFVSAGVSLVLILDDTQPKS